MKKIFIICSTIVLMSPMITSAFWPFTSSDTTVMYSSNMSNSSYGAGGTYTNGGYGSANQCGTNSLTLCTVINRIIGYLNQALFLLIGLSVVVFVYNIFKYFIQPNENRKEAGAYVMYSIIGFFVILSMWGLVNILQNTFGIGNSGFSHNTWTDVRNIFPTN